MILSVDPDIAGCVIPVAHGTHRLRSHLLCLFLRQLTALASVIKALNHGQRTLHLRLDLHRIAVRHGLLIHLDRLLHRLPQIIDTQTRQPDGWNGYQNTDQRYQHHSQAPKALLPLFSGNCFFPHNTPFPSFDMLVYDYIHYGTFFMSSQ